MQERYAIAKQTYRVAEEKFNGLQSKVLQHETPRLLQKFRDAEAQRSRDVVGYILSLIDLERRCAAMNESYANEMATKLKQINLQEDDRVFASCHIQSANSVPPPVAGNSSMTFINEITYPINHINSFNRVPSMPPAYTTEDIMMTRLEPFSISVGDLPNHVQDEP